jgi:hypothetical protein
LTIDSDVLRHQNPLNTAHLRVFSQKLPSAGYSVVKDRKLYGPGRRWSAFALSGYGETPPAVAANGITNSPA